MVATAVLLVRRLRRATPTHRRVLVPLFSYGIAAVLFIALSGNVLVRLLEMPAVLVAVLQLVAIAGIPVAFVLGILLGSFARTGQLEELGTWLGAAGGERPALTSALAATLGDPSLEVTFWCRNVRRSSTPTGCRWLSRRPVPSGRTSRSTSRASPSRRSRSVRRSSTSRMPFDPRVRSWRSRSNGNA
jgi:hypothetical protein